MKNSKLIAIICFELLLPSFSIAQLSKSVSDSVVITQNILRYDREIKFRHEKEIEYGIGLSFGVDYLPFNFNNFREIIGSYNVDLLNKSSANALFGIYGEYKHFILGLEFGLSGLMENYRDSLNIDIKTNEFGLTFGYKILNNKRLKISPSIALKWYNIDLLNGAKNSNIPLEDYIQNRDLNLSFNQIIGVIGLNCAYKFYNESIFHIRYSVIGVYGGYAFKLHNTPLIYTSLNTISTNKTINLKNLYMGIYYSTFF